MHRWLALVTLLTGCPFTAPIPQARVGKGPAAKAMLSPIAALQLECQSTATWISEQCGPAYDAAVTNQLRMELELDGYDVVGSELINAELRRRHATIHDGEVVTEEVTGARWADLPATDQRTMLVDMGIRGALHSKYSIGLARGMASQRTVTVSFAIDRVDDDALAWWSSCSVETGDYHTTAQAIELATHCALESARLW